MYAQMIVCFSCSMKTWLPSKTVSTEKSLEPLKQQRLILIIFHFIFVINLNLLKISYKKFFICQIVQTFIMLIWISQASGKLLDFRNTSRCHRRKIFVVDWPRFLMSREIPWPHYFSSKFPLSFACLLLFWWHKS